MAPMEVDGELLHGLLSPADPALRQKVLTDLLEHPLDDPDVVATRARIPENPWVKATLAAHNGDGTWGRGFYHKYDGTSWALLHLSEVGAPMELAPIQAGVERLLETALPVGEMTGARAVPFQDLAHGVIWKDPIACLTAHMALVLIRAGRWDHPVTRGGPERLLASVRTGQGVRLFRGGRLPPAGLRHDGPQGPEGFPGPSP